MPGLKTYGDIYDEEFLEKFGDYRKYVEEAELEKEFEVDVKEIAKLCKIEVTEDDLDVVEDQDEMGACKMMHSVPKAVLIDYVTDVENRKVKINCNRTEEVKRFNLAHEIGHILLRHESISYRDSNNQQYNDFIKRMNEVNINNFATELLMPENLLRKALENTMFELNYDSDQKFSDSDIDYLAENTAKKMLVSVESFKYRLKNLNIFR